MDFIEKNGYNVDELYTYGLSNSYYEPFIEISENTKLTSGYFEEYFTVQNDEKFEYKSVYNNQTRDVHPPLYYFLFHTISSITPNLFSKWTGIALNIILFILSWLIMYKMSKLILKDSYLSLLPPIVWGFSSGAISSVVFIRMYVLMTVFVLLTSYIHLKSIKEQRYEINTLLWIFSITFLGVMTHYYYVVFACFLSIVYCIYLLYKKKIKYLVCYVLIMFSSLLSAILFYPALIDHIFYGYRGTEAVSSFSENTSSLSGTFSDFFSYYKIVDTSLFSNTLNYLLVIFILLILYVRWKVIPGYKDKKLNGNEIQGSSSIEDKDTLFILLGLLFSSAMYIFIIAQVAPYKADRYIFPVMPIIIFTVVIAFVLLMGYIFKNKKSSFLLLCLFVIFNLGSTFTNNSINYLYENRDMEYLTEQKNRKTDELAILFYDNSRVRGAQVTNSAQYLIYYEDSYIFSTKSGIEKFKKLNLDKKKAMIYFGYAVDGEMFANEILEKTKYTKYMLVDDSIGSYLFE